MMKKVSAVFLMMVIGCTNQVVQEDVLSTVEPKTTVKPKKEVLPVKGVALSCAVRDAFMVGRDGGQWNEDCTKNAGEIAKAYKMGADIYQAERAVVRVKTQLATIRGEIQQREREIVSVEASLMYGFGSPKKRKNAETRVRDHQDQIVELERRLGEVERQRVRREQELGLLLGGVPSEYQ